MGTAGARAQGRLVGLDAARFLALLGMMATHLLATRSDSGDPTWVAEVLSGRASALFALLAGVSLSLMTGGPRPLRGEARVARSAGLLVRALAVGLLGLVLGGVDSGVAVILVNYAVLLAIGVLLVGYSARLLAVLCLLATLVTPVLLWWVRPGLPPRGYDSPSIEGLEEPGRLVSEVLFTGYYPVLVWSAYLLAGMALGRLDLRRVPGRVLGLVAVAAALVAATAELVSDRLLAREGTVRRLDRDLWLLVGRDDEEALERLHRLIDTGLYGQTPVDGAWQWLLVSAPHSSTTLDLLRTGGVALAVVALLVWALRALDGPGRSLVAVLTGAGAMTLTLYTLHVLMSSDLLPPAEGRQGTVVQVGVVVVAGAVVALLGRRGPLEGMVALAARGTERLVRGPSGGR
ncbi:heparan-alpha-glucosaminide N-acetyltransferase domain-containing protein [Nocardioides sp.]|uniref:heparan-alpha-glucosaminide N-acetyltransferase domain-containing protein n=2 Tax=Nocardioides sp. TaxID=35761 RepID=UPI003513C94F